MLIDNRGVTRKVLIFKKFVIKFPYINQGSKFFILGLMSNLNESVFNSREIPSEINLPEIYFTAPFGLFLIMKRYRPVKHRGLFWVELEKIKTVSTLHEDFWDSDRKPENFGYDGTTLIKLDNGSS